jgi:hypothetical protein
MSGSSEPNENCSGRTGYNIGEVTFGAFSPTRPDDAAVELDNPRTVPATWSPVGDRMTACNVRSHS